MCNNNAKVCTGNNAELINFDADMTALLGDNNFRMLDKNTNACVQNHNTIGVGAVYM